VCICECILFLQKEHAHIPKLRSHFRVKLVETLCSGCHGHRSLLWTTGPLSIQVGNKMVHCVKVVAVNNARDWFCYDVHHMLDL
jgi:hypothetical protein